MTGFAVRAGINRDPISLGTAIREQVLESGDPCLSIFISEQLQGETRHATLLRISQEAFIPHNKIMVSSLNRLANKGFLPIPDSSDGQGSYHCLIFFELPVQELQVIRFIACFDEPEANPAKGIN